MIYLLNMVVFHSYVKKYRRVFGSSNLATGKYLSDSLQLVIIPLSRFSVMILLTNINKY